MDTTVTSPQLTVSQKIAKGSRIEAYFSPDKGLDVDVDGETILTAREFHMVLTTHSGGELKIRCHEKHGDVDEWHDIHVPNITVYAAISRDNV